MVFAYASRPYLQMTISGPDLYDEGYANITEAIEHDVNKFMVHHSLRLNRLRERSKALDRVQFFGFGDHRFLTKGK